MPSLDVIIEKIQAKGERVTIQRRRVIEALCATDDHVSVADIQRWIEARYPTQELPDATIYRILQRLKEMALVSQTDMGSAGIVYQLLDGPRHHHLICLLCGKVINLDDGYLGPVRETLLADFGFQARIDHMAIYGLCAECAAQEAAERDPRS